MTTALYATNHNPAALKGDYANRPAGTDLQNLPFLTTYLATNTTGTGAGTMSIVGGIGNTRQWLEFSATQNAGTKDPARLATTAALPAYTASGDKTTLTANANGAFPAVDGFTLSINQRILVKNGASAVDNGIYQLAASGSGGTPWVLVRTADMPVGDAVSGETVTVEQGTINGSQQFVVTSVPGSDVVGTNNITFAQQTGLGLAKYWVSPPGINPVAEFTDPQSAINAAVLDGHNASNPAAIMLNPNGQTGATYVGNITLFDGIGIFGVGSGSYKDIAQTSQLAAQDTGIIGEITLDAGFVRGSLTNIAVGTAGKPALDIGAAANLAALTLTNVRLSANFSTGATLAGAPVAAAGILTLNNCQVLNPNAGAGAIGLGLTTALVVVAQQTSFLSASGTQATISRAGGTGTFENCSIKGRIDYSAVSTDTFTNCQHSVTGATSYFNVTAGAPTINWNGGSRKGSTATTPYTGTFTLAQTQHIGDANSESYLTTMTVTAVRQSPVLTAAATVGATVTAAQFLAAGDVVVVDTSGGAGAVQLPLRSLCGNSPRWIVSSPTGAASAIVVTRGAGDTIGGSATNLTTSALLATHPACCLLPDPNSTTNWLVLSQN